MPLSRETENLATGIKEIDDQHRTLVAVLRNFSAATSQGDGRSAQSTILGQLKSYADIHFKTEEGYMQHFAYPALETEEHMSRHEEFRLEVEEFEVEFLTQHPTDMAQRITAFVSHWLKDHIEHYDRKLCEFIMQRLFAEDGTQPK